jgi:hypothetical protein
MISISRSEGAPRPRGPAKSAVYAVAISVFLAVPGLAQDADAHKANATPLSELREFPVNVRD